MVVAGVVVIGAVVVSFTPQTTLASLTAFRSEGQTGFDSIETTLYFRITCTRASSDLPITQVPPTSTSPAAQTPVVVGIMAGVVVV